MREFITYAQNNEDIILAAFFSDVKKGTYVDIGANHPVDDSVTKHFYLQGWRGINVEPIAALHTLLQEDRPEDTNVLSGISDKPGTLTLRQYDSHGLSTFSPEIKKQYSRTDGEVSYKDVKVPVVTLKELFQKHPLRHIHFMKVDVEGFEYEVLLGNDWKYYRPEMICIEANHGIAGKDWHELLSKQGYENVYNDGLNDYYLAQEANERKKNFSYVEAMILQGRPIHYHHYRHREDLQSRLRDAEIKLEVAQLRAKQLQDDKQRLEADIAEQQRFRNALKLSARALDRVVMAQIERLHVSKLSNSVRPHGEELPAYDNSSVKDMLGSMHVADVRAYFSTGAQRRTPKFRLYRVVKGGYVGMRRAVAKGGRTAVKALKKVRRG